MDVNKSKVIKLANHYINTFKADFIKKCRSNHHFQTDSKEELHEFLNQVGNEKEHSRFSWLFSQHYVHFIQMRDGYLIFTVNFPHSYENVTDLYKTTDFYVRWESNHGHASTQTASFDIYSARSMVDDYSYVINMLNDYDVFDKYIGSHVHLRTEVFSLLAFSEESKRFNFIDSLKDDREVLDSLMEKKNEFLTKRQENNRKKKDFKQRNKGAWKKEIEENEKMIRSLERQAQALRNKNNQLRSGQNMALDDSDINTFQEAGERYENAMKHFLAVRVGRIRQSHFNSIYETLLKTK